MIRRPAWLIWFVAVLVTPVVAQEPEPRRSGAAGSIGPVSAKRNEASTPAESAATVPHGAAEPVFRGKLLRQWMLELKDEDTRGAAIEALGQLGPRAKAAVPELVKLLDQPDSYIKVQAIRALGLIGRDVGDDAARRLGVLLEDKTFKIEAARALSRIGAGARPALPGLMRVLDREGNKVSINIITSIGNIGPDAKKAIPPLYLIMTSSQKSGGVPEKKEAAAIALLQVDRDEGDLRALLEEARLGELEQFKLSQARSAARWFVLERGTGLILRAARRLGPRAAFTVPTLRSYLKKKDLLQNTRLEVIQALGDIGPAAKAAVADLVAHLHDNNKETRLATIKTLGNIGLDAVTSAAELRRLHDDPDSDIRREAAAALEKIKPSTADKRPRPAG